MPKQTFAACVTDHIEMCCISNPNDRSNGSFLLRLPLSCRLSSSLSLRLACPVWVMYRRYEAHIWRWFVCLTVCLSVCLSACPPVYLSVYLYIFLSDPSLSPFFSMCIRFVCLSVGLPVVLSGCANASVDTRYSALITVACICVCVCQPFDSIPHLIDRCWKHNLVGGGSF